MRAVSWWVLGIVLPAWLAGADGAAPTPSALTPPMTPDIPAAWFPLYDRNPQTYVSNIFLARSGDYRKATQRVFHTAGAASFIELPVVGKR